MCSVIFSIVSMVFSEYFIKRLITVKKSEHSEQNIQDNTVSEDLFQNEHGQVFSVEDKSAAFVL